MTRAAVTVAIILLLASCGSVPAKLSAPVCYRASDASRYTVLVLQLDPDSSYKLTVHAHMALPDIVTGTWSEVPTRIDLSPSSDQTSSAAYIVGFKKYGNGTLMAEEPRTDDYYSWLRLYKLPCGS